MSEKLPNGWISDYITRIVYSVKTGVPEFNGEIEYYSTGSIQKDGCVSDGSYTFNNRPSRANRIGLQNDILQARMKETDKGLIINNELIGQLFSTGFIQLRPYGSTLEPRYLYYYILSPNFLNQRDDLATGSTQEALTDTRAVELTIPLPPLNEQKRIVAKLEAIMPRIETMKQRLEKVPDILKRFRQSVLANATTGKLTEKWREEHPETESAEVLLEKIRRFRIKNADNKRELNAIIKNYDECTKRLCNKETVYSLPDTWKYCEINSIGNVYNGSTPSRKVAEYWQGEINWVSSGEVANNRISKTHEQISKKGFDNSSVKLLPKGTVLIAMIGEGKTRGQAAILDVESTCNQNVAAVVINHGYVMSEYLYNWFYMQYDRNRSLGSGSGPKALNCQRVRELDFILPPLEEQKEIVKQVDKLFAMADKVEVHYHKVKERINRLSHSILAKAFRGELVPQDPNDQPAEILLERILEEKAKLEASKKAVRKKGSVSKVGKGKNK